MVLKNGSCVLGFFRFRVGSVLKRLGLGLDNNTLKSPEISTMHKTVFGWDERLQQSHAEASLFFFLVTLIMCQSSHITFYVTIPKRSGH